MLGLLPQTLYYNVWGNRPSVKYLNLGSATTFPFGGPPHVIKMGKMVCVLWSILVINSNTSHLLPFRSHGSATAFAIGQLLKRPILFYPPKAYLHAEPIVTIQSIIPPPTCLNYRPTCLSAKTFGIYWPWRRRPCPWCQLRPLATDTDLPRPGPERWRSEWSWAATRRQGSSEGGTGTSWVGASYRRSWGVRSITSHVSFKW